MRVLRQKIFDTFTAAPAFAVLNMTTGELEGAFPDDLEGAIRRAERRKTQRPTHQFVVLGPVTELNAGAAIAYSNGKRHAEVQARSEIMRAEAAGELHDTELTYLRKEVPRLRRVIDSLLDSLKTGLQTTLRDDEIPF